MLAICLRDGLTAGDTVYRHGDIFKLSDITQKEYGDLPEDKMGRKQKRVYGELIFRLPTPEELRTAYIAGKLKLNELNDKEKKMLAIALKSRKAKEEEAIRVLSENALTDKNIDDAEDLAEKEATAGK